MATLSKEGPVRSIKLTSEQISELMQDLDNAASASGNEQSCRLHERFPCRADAVIVKIEPHGLPSKQFVVPIRNISEGGVAFLHNTMLHQGTHCTIYVLLEKGRSFKTTGRVVRCRYLHGMIHEVGLKFDVEEPLVRNQDDGAAGH
jgi:hypothetical protein